MKKVISTLLVAAILCGALLSGCSLDEITGKGGGDTLYMVASWETVGMKNHSNGGASIGTLLYFAIEPLIQYVRSTDEIYFMLAESVEHRPDGTSLIHLRPDAKWHNGDDYVAMDTVAWCPTARGGWSPLRRTCITPPTSACPPGSTTSTP